MRTTHLTLTTLAMIATLSACSGKTAAKPEEMTTFTTENAATSHCHGDKVVWINLPTGVYHYKGGSWYGHTKHGAYACEKDAVSAGDKASKNGE
jgi:hypothetical protein